MSTTKMEAPGSSRRSLDQAIRKFNQVLWTQSLPQTIEITRSCPMILSHTNAVGYLPIHMAIKCTRSQYRSDVIKFIIEEGINNNVGGREGRGGLLTRTKDKYRTALCLLVVGDDKTDILDYLVKRQPPLLSSQDVIDYHLLHHAAGDPFFFKDRFNTIRFLIDLCPQALGVRNDIGDLPIHHACKQPGYCLNTLQMFLNEGVRQGVFLEKNGRGKPFLKCVLEEHIIPLLEGLDTADVPVLQGVIGVVDEATLRIMIDKFDNFPRWCHIRDKQGRLPLHVGAEHGLRWENELRDILEANKLATSVIDPISNLYPYSLAACDCGTKKCGCDLDVIYELSRCNPDCIGFQTDE
mmetsp:Transcript_15239/g.18548  ORF Transcript_15239/g.18548 Transcript_15239/m.18548 type:complete len:352 (+) Transcript_15239:256-1311(+)